MSKSKKKTVPNQIVLTPGTLLYHGTDVEEFAAPALKAPAWFAFDYEQAARWSGWVNPTSLQERRVLVFRVDQPLALEDVRSRTHWENFCIRLVGDDEAGTYEAAHACASQGILGWHGNDEVMLTNLTGLTFVEEKDVESNHPCFGTTSRFSGEEE
jgi:hypothetical protein